MARMLRELASMDRTPWAPQVPLMQLLANPEQTALSHLEEPSHYQVKHLEEPSHYRAKHLEQLWQ
jgi:hypothetical protein